MSVFRKRSFTYPKWLHNDCKVTIKWRKVTHRYPNWPQTDPKMIPKWPQSHPHMPQVLPKWPQSVPKAALRCQKWPQSDPKVATKSSSSSSYAKSDPKVIPKSPSHAKSDAEVTSKRLQSHLHTPKVIPKWPKVIHNSPLSFIKSLKSSTFMFYGNFASSSPNVGMHDWGNSFVVVPSGRRHRAVRLLQSIWDLWKSNDKQLHST